MKNLVLFFLIFQLSLGYSASAGESEAQKNHHVQVPDSPQEEIASDTAQKIPEEEFTEEDQFKAEVLNYFSNKDEILFEDIDDFFVRDLGDILRTRSLLSIVKVGPPGQLEAGSPGGNRDLRIFIDGILYVQRSLSLPQKGVLDLNSIPVEDIEKIEILPPAAANLWGRGSGLGGINVITKDYSGSEPYSRVTVDRGPSRYRRTQVELGRELTSRGTVYITGGFRKSNGYVTNSDYDGSSLSAKASLGLKKNLNLRFFAHQYKAKMGLPFFPEANLKDTRKQENNWGISGTLLFKQNRNSFLRLDLCYDKGEQESKSLSAGFEIKKTNKHLSLRAMETLKWRTRHNFKLEAWAGRKKLEASNSEHVAYGTYLSLSDVIHMGGKMNLVLFAKMEKEDEFKVNFSGSGGISYRIAPDLNLFSSLGRFVGYPSAMDLYWRSLTLSLNDTTVNYVEEGNLDLRPEKSTIFDVGLSWRKKNLEMSGFFFKNRVNDFVHWANVDTSIAYGYWKSINTKADIWGVNLNSVIHFFNRFQSSISYCLKESKDSDKGLFFPYSPKHSLFGCLQYENEFLKREIGLKLRLETNILSERFLDEYEKDKEGGVAIFNGKITIRFLDFHFYYVVENITDRVYRLTQDYPMPERSWWWGFYWEFFD